MERTISDETSKSNISIIFNNSEYHIKKGFFYLKYNNWENSFKLKIYWYYPKLKYEETKDDSLSIIWYADYLKFTNWEFETKKEGTNIFMALLPWISDFIVIVGFLFFVWIAFHK